MKKILVTGATGFIGNYVVENLLQKDCYVVATSLNESKARKLSWFNRVEYISLNIEKIDSKNNYYNFFKNPDIVIHLAWEGLPNYQQPFHIEKNLPIHIKFLQNLISFGLKDLTVVGTCFEYGMQEGCLNENMPSLPQNSYAQAKNLLRINLEEFQAKYPFSLKWLRLFYMYGEGQNSNSLFSQLEKAIENGDQMFNMSGGEQTRDYLPVEKMANYITEIALQNKYDGIINCCSGEPIAVKSLVQLYLKERNKNIILNTGYYPYNQYEPMHFWGDNTKLKSILNQPKL